MAQWLQACHQAWLPEFVPVTNAVEGENWLPLVVPLVPFQMLNNHMTVPLQINN